MSDHISETISESEQMYLITIARSLEDGGPDPLPLSHIAKKLSLQPVSVNQMVRKLEGEGLVHYHPYKGVELTDRGQVIASRTLRNRRLWQLFLVDQLQVSLEEADAMACDLEHITPDDIAQRLSSYLDEPAVGPGGHPIPALNGDHIKPSAIPLSQIDVGMSLRRVATEYEVFPQSVRSARTARASLISEGNPLQGERNKRADWAKDLSVKTFTEGMEVLYPGLYQEAEAVVKTAMEEDVDVLGLSFLSGGQLIYTPKVVQGMRESGMEEVLLLVGGVFPKEEIPVLKAMGVDEVFMSRPAQEIIEYIKKNVRRE